MTIKELRIEARLLQKELAKEIGVTRVSITNWECGLRNPSMANLKKLEKFFGKRVNF